MFCVNALLCKKGIIPIGHRKDDDGRKAVFPMYKYYQQFGYPTRIEVTHQRPGEEVPYNVAKVSYPEDGELTAFDVEWTIDEIDTGIDGTGEVQVSYYFTPSDEDGNCKTDVYKTLILPSLGEAGEAPGPYDDFIEQVAAIYEDLPEITAPLGMTYDADTNTLTVTKGEETVSSQITAAFPNGKTHYTIKITGNTGPLDATVQAETTVTLSGFGNLSIWLYQNGYRSIAGAYTSVSGIVGNDAIVGIYSTDPGGNSAVFCGQSGEVYTYISGNIVYQPTSRPATTPIDLNTAFAAKQDKLTAGDGISIENGVISATYGGMSVVSLWQNTSPNATFNAQTISAAWDNYSIILIAYKPYLGYVTVKTETVITAYSEIYNEIGCVYLAQVVRRNFALHTGGEIQFQSGQSLTGDIVLSSNWNTDASACVPIAVYGIK